MLKINKINVEILCYPFKISKYINSFQLPFVPRNHRIALLVIITVEYFLSGKDILHCVYSGKKIVYSDYVLGRQCL